VRSNVVRFAHRPGHAATDTRVYRTRRVKTFAENGPGETAPNTSVRFARNRIGHGNEHVCESERNEGGSAGDRDKVNTSRKA